MRRVHGDVRGPRLAAGLLALSLAAAGTAGWRAWQIEVPNYEDSSSPAVETPDVADSADAPVLDVMAVVDKDPFHPERRRPTRRFRLPSERVGVARRAAPGPSLPPSTALAGTMVYPGGGGAAILRQPGRATRIVRVGEAVGDLTLTEVDREQAIFVASNGARVVVRVSRPGG